VIEESFNGLITENTAALFMSHAVHKTN